MTEKKRIVFIVNPISGTQAKEEIIRDIDAMIDPERYSFEIVKTAYAGHATQIAQQAVEDGAHMVVAIGGDGTVNETARALVHTQTALGIIPCGSGNGLARHCHIPMDSKKAIEVINQGYTVCIDTGKVNEDPFFCTCGVGFDAFVSLKFAESEKRGLLTYLENTLHESLTYKPQTYIIEDEEGQFKEKAFLIACGNASQYGNNAYIAPHASLMDGLMDVTVLHPFTVLDVPQLAFQLFNKQIHKNECITTFRARKITIIREKEEVLHYDGDPKIGPQRLTVEIIPNSLNIVIPENAENDEEMDTWLQQFNEFFKGLKPKGEELLQKRYNHLFELNRQLLNKLSKKN